ncbi:MAG: flagellar protein FlgN [Gammaproteobacteria bacterium]|nr:flagellar protein FlgN [Gammaproteobacteria bacterium]
MNEHQRVQCSQQIDQILTLQISQVSSYIDYLSDIKSAISSNNTQQLNELLEKQQLNPELIEKTQQQQIQTLTEFGYDLNDEGLTSCIQDCDNTSKLTSQKNTLTEKLKELEKSLLINALIVQKNQHRVKQSIRLLSGHKLSNSVSSYSKQGGIESHEDSGHSLAEA